MYLTPEIDGANKGLGRQLPFGSSLKLRRDSEAMSLRPAANMFTASSA
jgi:hypothetical protein